MNNITKQHASMTLTSAPWFGAFSSQIDQIRGDFRAFVREELQDKEEYRAHEQARWKNTYGTVCYYFPYWIGQALGYPSDSRAVRSAALGNFYLYQYYTLRDDALDDGSIRAELAAFGGDLCLARGLESFAQTGVAATALMSQFARCLRVAVSAERRLANTEPSRFAPESMRTLSGEKASLARLAAFALAVTPEQAKLLPQIDAALNKLAVGLQLADDLLDWREDFLAGRYTLVTLEGLLQGELSTTKAGCAELGRRIFDGGIADATLKTLIDYVDSAAALLPSRATFFLDFLRRLRLAAETTRTEIARHEVPWPARQKHLQVVMQGGGGT